MLLFEQFPNMTWGQRVALINAADPTEHLLNCQEPSYNPFASNHHEIYSQKVLATVHSSPIPLPWPNLVLPFLPSANERCLAGLVSVAPSPICFWLQPHASAAYWPCQNLTAIHTSKLWFLLLLLTVLGSSHLFTNKRDPCLFTQGWGRGAAEEGRCLTGICFMSVYPHFSVHHASDTHI